MDAINGQFFLDELLDDGWMCFSGGTRWGAQALRCWIAGAREWLRRVMDGLVINVCYLMSGLRVVCILRQRSHRDPSI